MKKILTTAFLSALLAACGGGSDDTSPPSVTATSPNTTARVPRNTEISVTFSEGLIADTITDANLRLTRKGTAVPGILTYDAASRKVTFVPQQALETLSSYTVTVGTGLKDLAGNSLAAERSWTFKTADADWQVPWRVDATGLPYPSKEPPRIAIDGEGNVLAVWTREWASSQFEVRAAAYSPATGWGAISLLNNALPGNSGTYPQIGFDGQGNGLAVWRQTESPLGTLETGIWAARYVKGRGWQAPVAVEVDDGVGDPALAVDAAGSAFVVFPMVWDASSGARDVHAARFTPAGGWEASVRVGSAAGTDEAPGERSIVMDGAGNAYVLWIQHTLDMGVPVANPNPVWFARYQAGSGWRPAVPVGGASGMTYGPKLALSGSGQLMALWDVEVFVPTSPGLGIYRPDIWSSLLASPGGTWSVPVLIENDQVFGTKDKALVSDSAGNFHAIWQQVVSGQAGTIHHRQYTPGTGWGVDTTISTANGEYDWNHAPSLVADRRGHVMAVWSNDASAPSQAGPQEGTFAQRYIAGEGWQAPVRIGDSRKAAMATSLAANGNGAIAAAWMELSDSNTTGPVWVNILKP